MTRKKTINNSKSSNGKSAEVTHPGKQLQQFIVQQGLYQMEAARYIGMTPSNLNDIVRGIRSVTADIALRLGKAFSTDPLYWLELQMHYDLARAKKDDRTIRKLSNVVVFKSRK